MPVLNHPAAKWDTSTALRQTDDRKHRRPLQAKSDVELSIGVAASTTTVLDSALSVVGPGSEASGGEENVRVIPLIHPCGDFALAQRASTRPQVALIMYRVLLSRR
jgi:hypothetical protein